MSREQIDELADDLMGCHTEFYVNGELYTNYYDMAQSLLDIGWHRKGKHEARGGSLSEMNKQTAKYYGYRAQSNQLVEECAELIQAVSKYRRAVTEDKKAVALENLIEEIADVEIMLEQVKYLLQISADEIEAMKIFKVNRTKERMLSNGS